MHKVAVSATDSALANNENKKVNMLLPYVHMYMYIQPEGVTSFLQIQVTFYYYKNITIGQFKFTHYASLLLINILLFIFLWKNFTVILSLTFHPGLSLCPVIASTISGQADTSPSML